MGGAGWNPAALPHATGQLMLAARPAQIRLADPVLLISLIFYYIASFVRLGELAGKIDKKAHVSRDDSK